MNFVDYCIATKNFSALDAVEDYTKSFGIAESLKGLKNKVMDATGLTKLNRMRNTLKKRAGMSDSDILKGLFNSDTRKRMGKTIDTVRDYAKNRNAFRNAARDGGMWQEYRNASKDTQNRMNASDKSAMEALNDVLSGRSYKKKTDAYQEDLDRMLKFVDKDKAFEKLRGYLPDKKSKKKFEEVHGTDED